MDGVSGMPLVASLPTGSVATGYQVVVKLLHATIAYASIRGRLYGLREIERSDEVG